MVGIYFKHRLIVDYMISGGLVALYKYAPLCLSEMFYNPSFLEVRDLGKTLFSTSASLLGFVLAAGTFLVSHVQSPSFDILRKSASYKELPRLVGSAMWRLSGLTSASLLLVIGNDAVLKYALAVNVFLIGMSATSMFSLTWIVMRILSVPPRS